MKTQSLLVIVFSMLLMVTRPPLGVAQECPGHLRCYSAREAVTLFVSEAEGYRSDLGHAAVLFILTHPMDATVVRRDSVADALEALALQADSQPVRVSAASYLSIAGSREIDGTRLASAPSRIKRIFRASTDRQVREMILMRSFAMADTNGMLPLLREVAQSPGVASPSMMFNHDADDATLAVQALAHMGEEGSAVLRELHRRKSVRSARAALVLDQLSQRGYRLGVPR